MASVKLAETCRDFTPDYWDDTTLCALCALAVKNDAIVIASRAVCGEAIPNYG
jgi:hypothetical protein